MVEYVKFPVNDGFIICDSIEKALKALREMHLFVMCGTINLVNDKEDRTLYINYQMSISCFIRSGCNINPPFLHSKHFARELRKLILRIFKPFTYENDVQENVVQVIRRAEGIFTVNLMLIFDIAMDKKLNVHDLMRASVGDYCPAQSIDSVAIWVN